MTAEHSSAPGGRTAGARVKARASQACESCRMRKVKCDLVQSGAPCHNCKIDGVDCVPAESRRSRHHRLRLGIPSGPTAPSFITFPLQTTRNSNRVCRPGVDSVASNARRSPQNPPTPVRDRLPSCEPASPQPLHETASRPTPVSGNPITHRLPAFISPPERPIRREELQYLAQSGALSIPDETLRVQLLHCYITYVYPFLPVICIEDFLKALENPGPNGPQLSLILFQAVMFAGVTSLDEQYLHQAGFDDRRSAQEYFFHKVKVLYDFDWEVDRIILVQAILLHTYWYTSEKQLKCPWHWLGVCISLATSVGLNEESTYTGQDPKTRRLWRRLWWCCYVRDRFMGVSIRRPMRLQDEKMNVSMLRLNDFDLQPLTTTIPGLRETLSVLSEDSRVALAKMLMAKVTLASIIGRGLNSLYILEVFDGPANRPRMLYTPKALGIDPVEARQLSSDLQQWENDLAEECRLTSQEDDGDPDVQFLHLHRVYLKLMLLLATEALHRPINLSRQQTTLAMMGLQSKSGRLLKDCAMNMADLLQQLRQRDLLHRLPPLTVTCLGAVIATLLGELKTAGKSLADLPRPCYQCIRGVWSLRDVWPIIDDGCQVLGHMIRATQDASVWTLTMKANRLRQPVAAEAAARSRDSDGSRRTADEQTGAREPDAAGASLSIEPGTADPMMPMPYVEADPLDLGVDLGFWWGQGDPLTMDLDDLDATILDPMEHYRGSTAGELSSLDDGPGLIASNNGVATFHGMQSTMCAPTSQGKDHSPAEPDEPRSF